MALVQIGVIVQDDDGDRSSVNVTVPSGTLTLAAIVEFAQDMAALIDACTDGQIVEIHLVIGVSLPEGLKANPVAYSDVEKGALLSFDVAGTEYRHSIRIPAFVESKFAGKAVDDEDVDVAALIAALEDGITEEAQLVAPSNRFELDLGTYIEGIKSFRRK